MPLQTPEQRPNSPLIIGAAGDIGRSALQQLVLERDIMPAGVVLRQERLATITSRQRTAQQIAENYHADGVQAVFEEVCLTPDELVVDGRAIPVFTQSSQHEILQDGHPVIEATGQYKTADALEPLLNDGASFVTVTGPMKDDTETIVAGVNGTTGQYERARANGIVSNSSCTTTGASSFFKPVADRLRPSAAQFTILHARTNSNTPSELRDTIKPSPSGAAIEIPKVLNLNQAELPIALQCSRVDVSCGSLAVISFFLNSKESSGDSHEIKARIIDALKSGTTSYELDDEIDSTRSVIGRRPSVIVNLSQMRAQKLPGSDSILVSDILGYYDNVGGYTRSVLDSFTLMDAMPLLMDPALSTH